MVEFKVYIIFTGLKFKEETKELLHLEQSPLWYQIKNTLKILKCSAGEGWRRSVGPIV
jgi:hypothetical protein